MRKLLTNWDSLVGKTIESIDQESRYMPEAVINFTDNSCVILKSASDFETGYHNNIDIVDLPTADQQVRVGIITEEEYMKISKQEGVTAAKFQLEVLKRNYPELFL